MNKITIILLSKKVKNSKIFVMVIATTSCLFHTNNYQAFTLPFGHHRSLLTKFPNFQDDLENSLSFKLIRNLTLKLNKRYLNYFQLKLNLGKHA